MLAWCDSDDLRKVDQITEKLDQLQREYNLQKDQETKAQLERQTLLHRLQDAQQALSQRNKLDLLALRAVSAKCF